eukprot:jgi/Chrpa1/21981/Chrysochromulina_OHIO_Genome00023087-RA
MGCFGPSKAEKDKKLWKAAEDGNEAELRRLIGLGGNVNWRNPNNYNGWSALHKAASGGRLAIVKRLLEGGADLALQNFGGQTALDLARQYGYSEVVALLSEPRDYLPLGERIAAICHRMRPRGRNGRPLGRHSASPLHALHIRRRVQNDRILGAVVGTSGVGGGLAAWFASLVMAETGRAGCATDSGTSTQGAAASTATDCLATFTTTLRKPSRFLIACDDAPCWAPLLSADSRWFARWLPHMWDKAAAAKVAADKAKRAAAAEKAAAERAAAERAAAEKAAAERAAAERAKAAADKAAADKAAADKAAADKAATEPQDLIRAMLERLAAAQGAASEQQDTLRAMLERLGLRAPAPEPAPTTAPSGDWKTRKLFEVPGTITEQMTQGVKDQVLSQLPEGVPFENFYPE